jgi:hypothetical protein
MGGISRIQINQIRVLTISDPHLALFTDMSVRHKIFFHSRFLLYGISAIGGRYLHYNVFISIGLNFENGVHRGACLEVYHSQAHHWFFPFF